MLPEASLKI